MKADSPTREQYAAAAARLGYAEGRFIGARVPGVSEPWGNRYGRGHSRGPASNLHNEVLSWYIDVNVRPSPSEALALGSWSLVLPVPSE